jgi:hypothetical protein
MKRVLPILLCFSLLFSTALSQSHRRKKPIRKPQPAPIQQTKPTQEEITAQHPPDWVEITSIKVDPDAPIKFFYSPRRITHPSPNSVRVWVKFIPTNERARQSVIENRTYNESYKEEGSRADYSNYAYTRQLFEFDCEQRRERVLSNDDFDRDGEKVGGGVADIWFYVTPDSTIEKIMEAACSH